MLHGGATSAEKEQRLNEALAEYLEAEEAGQAPDHAAFVAQYPDLADELNDFFDNRAQLVEFPDLQRTLLVPVMLPPADAVPTSDRFGDYELLEEIARGGMGVVYKACQLSANRVVALKMILASAQASPSARQRFRIEAEAAANLDHPNIVPIYDVGEIHGQLYFTMKLVEGGSLAARRNDFFLQSSSSPGQRRENTERQQRLAELLAAVARAVHHAHQHGILHRDLKPANILLQEVEKSRSQEVEKSRLADFQTSRLPDFVVPLVADFGLAKRTNVESHLTQSQAIVGTAEYLAPEQAQPGKDGLTTAVDVYSLGSILYEMLTGRPPFVSTSFFDTLIQVVHEPPVPPCQRNPQVASDLNAICLKCLQKEPWQRYGSALELAEDLERWRAGEAISLRPLGTVERACRWARRNRLAAVLLVTVACLMVVVTVGSVLAAWHIAAARDEADRNADAAMNSARKEAESAAEANQARDLARAALEQKQRLLVAGHVANGTRALDAGDPFGALVWYSEALRQVAGTPSQEEPHRVRLAGVLHRCPRIVGVWFDNEAHPAFSPDGRRVVLLHKDVARAWRVDTGEAASAPLQHKDEVRRATFSPDGNRLLTVAADGSSQVWHLGARQPGNSLPLKHGKAVTFAAFSRDGSRVVTVGTDHTARVWKTSDGTLAAGPFRHNTPMLHASFSQDGTHLVTCGGEIEKHGEVRVWDLTGAKNDRPLSFTPGVVVRSAFLTADGKHVVGLGGYRMARLWELATGKELAAVSGVRMYGEGTISPDGAHVLKLEGSSARVVNVATGQPVTPPLLHGGEVYLSAFSPNGRAVVTAGRDRVARVWDAISGQALTPPLWHGRAISWAGFSADGRMLSTAAEDGSVRVWELAGRFAGSLAQPLAPLPTGSPATVSPDGSLTAVVEKNGAVSVHDAVTGKAVTSPWKLSEPVTHLTFAPDGRRILAVTATSARVWDTASDRPVTPVLPHAGDVQEALFTPDGSRVVVKGAKNLLQVWDAATGAVQSSEPLSPRATWRGLALTNDGRAGVAVRPAKSAEVRDVVSGELRAGPFRHGAAVTQVALSPDGRLLAVGTADGSAVLWDVTGHDVHPVTAPLQHGSPLHQVAFSGDGRRLVTVGEDGSARVWDVATGLPLSPLLTQTEPITRASLSADGWRMSTRGKSGAWRVWNLAPDERPLEDLLYLTELLSGQTLDGKNGGFEPAGIFNLRAAWPRIRARYPQEFRPSVP